MNTQKIKNVVFDIGNVMVRWSPQEITRLTFGDHLDVDSLALSIFKSDIWLALNKGQLTEDEAKLNFQKDFNFSTVQAERFFYYVKETQLLLYGSVELLTRIKTAGYRVFALTDNVNEIVEYLKKTYRFWPIFEGAVVSSEVGVLKPQAEIFQEVLRRFALTASQTVFLDDMPHNVEGARAVGIHAIKFENAQQCETDLKNLGLKF